MSNSLAGVRNHWTHRTWSIFLSRSVSHNRHWGLYSEGKNMLMERLNQRWLLHNRTQARREKYAHAYCIKQTHAPLFLLNRCAFDYQMWFSEIIFPFRHMASGLKGLQTCMKPVWWFPDNKSLLRTRGTVGQIILTGTWPQAHTLWYALTGSKLLFTQLVVWKSRPVGQSSCWFLHLQPNRIDSYLNICREVNSQTKTDNLYCVCNAAVITCLIGLSAVPSCFPFLNLLRDF